MRFLDPSGSDSVPNGLAGCYGIVDLFAFSLPQWHLRDRGSWLFATPTHVLRHVFGQFLGLLPFNHFRPEILRILNGPI